jgi:poly(A)-specific ribonuclease
VEDAVGFRRVVDAIIESRKPLLGHNFLVDCIQIVTQFKGSPAPTCAEFKQQLHELFPVFAFRFLYSFLFQAF